MNKVNRILIALCTFASLGANANEKNWYAGASFGSTSFGVDKADFINEFVNSIDSTFDKTDTGFKVYGGYQINEYFAVEMAYANLGQLTYKDGTYEYFEFNSFWDGSTETYAVFSRDTSIEVSGFMVNGVVQYPISDNVALFAKLGAFSWNSDTSMEYSYNYYGIIDGEIQSEPYELYRDTLSESASGTDAFYGVGLSYKIADFDIRAEYEIYKSEGESINVASIGALYRF